MKILVCVKEVPASETFVSVAENGDWINVKERAPYRINRFDEYAVEEAVRIKETIPGTRVDVITMGPEGSAEMLRKAMGMGADEGIHIVDHDKAYKSPLEIASRIAEVIGTLTYDLILTGIMSEDMMHAQTGPVLAEILGRPCAVGVVKVNLTGEASTIQIEREMEGGLRDCLEVDLPALLTIQAGINKPRYPALSNMLKARKKKIRVIQVTELSASSDSGVRLTGVSYPGKSRSGKVLTGTYEEMADELIKILKKKNILN